MHRSIIKNFTIEHSFYLFAAAFLLLVPLRLALAWVLAVVIHEASHYLALRACKVSIYSTSISAAGIKMQTELMTGRQEFICTLAGPFGGFFALLFARWLPCTAICAFVQSIFNLFPVYPLDGGRALRCMLFKLLGDRLGERICIWTGYVFTAMLVISAFVLALRFDMGMLPILLTIFFLGKSSLQTEVTNSTIA